MGNIFLSVYTFNEYNKPENIIRKTVLKDSFIDIFLNIDWSQGTIHTYPNYPNEPRPKNHLFLFDIIKQTSLSFDIEVSNDWAYEFILSFGNYQKESKSKYIGKIESFETSCYDENEMLNYIEDFFNRKYTTIKKLKNEAGIYHSHKFTFEL
ncbi:hypothetical protein [uncultured Polaribacter sp.]|uniref:hypothetical protein n=1 Tax=uncultured Polaribacter sp. TaxID=174711 RepID=UPI00261CE5DF|nr:hypothetical protein [uncultured Polaribacter sp.]